VSLRARLAAAAMSPRVVRMVEPLTRRRVRHLGITVRTDSEVFDRNTRAEMLFGLYERAECLYVRDHLKGSDFTIEVGAGLGVCSAHVAAGMARGGHLICVDANPEFVPAIERNVAPYAARNRLNVTVLNAGIANRDDAVLNVEANPFASHVGAGASTTGGRTIPIPGRTLASLVDEYEPPAFDLVCDIEGGEASFVLAEGNTGLERCRRIVIELHDGQADGVEFSPADLLQALTQRWGFSVLAQKGPIAALGRSLEPRG
jgi:FkbM family methyltransferase